jgi:hypothetical protein
MYMDNKLRFLEAAAGGNGGSTGKPKVLGVAYNGGKMNLPYWGFPVVVEMSGLSIPESVPLLANHENRTNMRVGLVRAGVLDGALEVEGEITAENDTATNIVKQGRAGADWQMSIGAEAVEFVLVPEGESRNVNGQSLDGPFYHVKKSNLREVSVVAVGADADTRMQIAAQFSLSGGPPMPKQSNPDAAGAAPEPIPDAMNGAPAPVSAAASPAPAAPSQTPEAPPISAAAPMPDISAAAAAAVAEERDRIAQIQEIAGGEFPDVEREAIRANWTPEAAAQEILKRLRASRPVADPRVTAWTSSSKPDTTKTLEAALCLRLGFDGDALAEQYGEPVVEAAYRDRRISLQSLMSRALRMEGKFVGSDMDNDDIRAAFSTVSVPGILSNVANKVLLRAYSARKPAATRLCREGDLANFNEAERYRLTDVGDLEKVAADGKLKHGSIVEEKAKNQVDTWGKLFTLTYKMIVNDDVGAFLKIPESLGARAARKIDNLFFARLLSNPDGLFSAAHKNYKAGVDSVLSADSLALATQMFLDQTDADGQPINVEPKFLLVPTSLRVAAKEILNSVTFMSTGSTDKQRIPTYNALADDDLEVVASPWLSNANVRGHSDKAWYLFGDPRVVDTFEIGYLKGQRAPIVEKTSADFDELGLKFRVYFNIGVREQDWRGMTKFAGQ